MGNAVGFGVPSNASVEHEGYCERLGKALCGVCVGIVLFFGTIGLLGWNEFNFVRNEEVLRYVSDRAVEVGCTADAANNGQPVWVSCQTTALWDFSRDPRLGELPRLFDAAGGQQPGVLAAAWLGMSSEIFQWVENKHCEEQSDGHGGVRRTCSYTYAQQWQSSAVDSTDFGCLRTSAQCETPSGQRVNPQNFGSIPALLQGRTYAPDNTVSVGLFGLNTGLLAQLHSEADLPPQVHAPISLPGMVDGKPLAIPDGSGVKFVLDATASPDRNGDVRVRFTKSAVAEGITTLSVVALQGPNPGDARRLSLSPWETGKSGTMSSVNWAAEGSVPLRQLLRLKASENVGVTWLLRVVGWLLMFLGLQLITGPMALMPQAVPCIGGLIGEVVGCALCCFNLAVSLSVSLLVISAAWLMARPLVGLCLLLAAVTLVAGAVCATRRLKTASSARHPLLAGPAINMAGPPFAMAAQHPQGMVTMSVTVPPSAGPGTQLQVQAPDGRQVLVTVPADMGPGQAFIAQLPAAGPQQFA